MIRKVRLPQKRRAFRFLSFSDDTQGVAVGYIGEWISWINSGQTVLPFQYESNDILLSREYCVHEMIQTKFQGEKNGAILRN